MQAEDVEPEERERRRVLGAAMSGINARVRAERLDPYAEVQIGYAVDLFTSPRSTTASSMPSSRTSSTTTSST